MKTIGLAILIFWVFAYPGVALSESTGTGAPVDEIRIGIMEHDVATRAKKHEGGHDLNTEFFFRSPNFRLMTLLGSPRPSFGISVNNQNDTSQFYSGLNWDLRFVERLFFSVGLGGAIHNGELQSSDPDRQRLGSRALFRAAIAAGFNFNKRMNVSVLFDHVSNGRLAYPNNGLEKFGIQFGYSY